MVAERQTTWGWLVTFGLFFTGAGAGVFAVSFLLALLNGNEPATTWGALVGPLLILIGAVEGLFGLFDGVFVAFLARLVDASAQEAGAFRHVLEGREDAVELDEALSVLGESASAQGTQGPSATICGLRLKYGMLECWQDGIMDKKKENEWSHYSIIPFFNIPNYV